MLKPLTAEEKAAHLRTIAHEAARLRDLAKLADAGLLAFLLENVLHDARAELGARGFPPDGPEPPTDPSGKVVPFR